MDLIKAVPILSKLDVSDLLYLFYQELRDSRGCQSVSNKGVYAW